MLNARSAARFRHLGQHFARAHSVAKDLHLAAHVGREAADPVRAGGIDEAVAHHLRLPPDDVRDAEDELDACADRGRLGLGIAHRSEHQRRPTRQLGRTTQTLRELSPARYREVEIMHFAAAEWVRLRPDLDAGGVEQRMQHQHAMGARGNAVDAKVAVLVGEARARRSLDEHARLDQRAAAVNAVGDVTLQQRVADG